MSLNKNKLTFFSQSLDTPKGEVINLIIVFLIVISSGIFVAQTYSIPTRVNVILNIVNTTILICFAIEYLLRLWSQDKKIKYIFSLYAMIDLIAILPGFIGIVDISFIRLLRWFRILRLIRFIEQKALFGIISNEDLLIFVRILFTLFAIVFVYSGLIYQVEHSVNPENFRNFLDAFYFSIVTMTTVGFGDVTPVSDSGRLLTVLMILTGITLIPWQISDLVKRLVEISNKVKILCSYCGLAFHDPDAIFCKQCGKELNQAQNNQQFSNQSHKDMTYSCSQLQRSREPETRNRE